MRAKPTLIATAAFALAALVAVGASTLAANVIEKRSAAQVSSRLLADGITWAQIRSDGLQIWITGTAPNEAARFRAVNLAGAEIDASRIRDRLEVTPVSAIEAPRFSIEMLRNDDGIQLIGLLPEMPGVTTTFGEADLAAAVAALTPDAQVADMLETAAFPAPEGWEPALRFGLAALKMLPRSKISVAADGVTVTAISDSEVQKRRFETDLKRIAPKGLPVNLSITAPRPVLTPFILRFVIDETGPHFDACSADTDRARDRILKAAAEAGMQGTPSCTIGLGVPTPRWGEAAERGIRALASLGQGTITFSDADVTLLGTEDTDQATFDRMVGELESGLPDVFSLDATLPRKATAPALGPAEFTATLDDSGKVELRGRLTDELLRKAVDSFARATFGAASVYTATRLDPDLPDGWPVRVLAGLEALGEVHSGSLLVRKDTVEVKGITGSQTARDRISQILASKLGQGKPFKVTVTYNERLDPLRALPTPAQCLKNVTTILARQKISFTPGSAEIAGAAGPTMTALAEALADCPGLRMEIAGHTDAQGSEEGNRALSQARAEAVLVALQGRRVDISGMRAVGYGETRPLTDNDTDLGREANRRIEFTLIDDPAPEAPGDAAADPSEAPRPATKPGAVSFSDFAAAVAAGETPPPPGNEAVPPTDAPGDTPAPASDAPTDAPAPGPADSAAPAATGPDFSADTSPSVAPQDKTRRPKPRPTP